MSKPVRIKDYLAAELEKIAARENRSLANLVNKLLEQAIEMDNRPITREKILPLGKDGYARAQSSTTPAEERNRTDADAESRDVRARTVGVESDFKPDPKPERKKR